VARDTTIEGPAGFALILHKSKIGRVELGPDRQRFPHANFVAFEEVDGLRPVMAATPARDAIVAVGGRLSGKRRESDDGHRSGHSCPRHPRANRPKSR
jgi:hypothetical protein